MPAGPKLPKSRAISSATIGTKGLFWAEKAAVLGCLGKKKASVWSPVVTLSYANGKGWENLRAPPALVLQSDIKHSARPRELIYFTRKPFIQCCPLRKMMPWLIFLFEMLIWVTASHLSHVQKKKSKAPFHATYNSSSRRHLICKQIKHKPKPNNYKKRNRIIIKYQCTLIF